MLNPPSPTSLSTRNCPSRICPTSPNGSGVLTGRDDISAFVGRHGSTVERDTEAAREPVALRSFGEDRVVLEVRPTREMPAEQAGEAEFVQEAEPEERLRPVGARVGPLGLELGPADAG